MQDSANSPMQKNSKLRWQSRDTTWLLSLYGTAIGAGTLFLPIHAGLHGLLPLLLIVILAYPMTFFSHRAFCRFILSGSKNDGNITAVANEHFGLSAGKLIILLYFFSIYPIVLMYSVAITNTTQSFLTHQLGLAPVPRPLLSLCLIASLMLIVRIGPSMVIRALSLLVYPFILILLLLSLYLIPHWSSAIFTQPLTTSLGNEHTIGMTLWLTIPILVFSFNHSPILSSFAVAQKHHYGQLADQKANRILHYAHLLMIFTVLFFVFSCVLSLSPNNLLEAKQQNITILSYLANHFNDPLISVLAPCIAFLAIAKSFLGHYLGASEGVQGLVQFVFQKQATLKHKNINNSWIDFFMLISCWLVASLNPNILSMIAMLSGPVIAILLFLMPMVAIKTTPAMQKYQSPFCDGFIAITGLIALTAIIYGLFA